MDHSIMNEHGQLIKHILFTRGDIPEKMYNSHAFRALHKLWNCCNILPCPLLKMTKLYT